ncbi:MAG TPA: ABC transporter permease [Thermoanaerobaculia bacterium]|nr:ABC transporter permease [Thermoanaerobaculia bacterium]
MLVLIRRAAQGLRRVPGFTALCVLTLAVGIGADTAVFSIVDAVLLRSLPYPRAERLVSLLHTLPGLGLKEVGQSDATYLLYRGHRRALAEIGIYRAELVNLTGGDSPERVPSARASASLFAVLGVAPALGRAFAAAEERPGAPPMVVLSDGLWRRKLGGDRRVLGRTLRIDGVTTQVIGVMPPEFAFPALDTALWLPLTIDPTKAAAGNLSYYGVARLAAGVTARAAAAELNAMARSLNRWLPGEDSQIMVASGLAAFVRPLRDDLVGEVGNALWVLFGAVGCILVIACANVANLLIVRGEGRQREMAIYTALGAPRRRLIGGVLAESLLIGLAAGGAGMLLAWGGLRLLAASRPAALARLAPAAMDLRALGFAAALAIVTSVLFGLVPAWRSSRLRELAAELKGGGRAMTMGRGRQRVRQVLVGLQLALALVLLTGSSLMLQSFHHLAAVDPGFKPAGVLTLEVALPPGAYPDDVAVARFFDQALARIAALPGAAAAGATSALPLQSATANGHLLEDFPRPDNAPPPVFEYQYVSPGYFRAMGIPLVAGRGLEPADAERRGGAVVVSAALARHYWPHGALGRRLRPGQNSVLRDPWYTIVGVAGDVRERGLVEKAGEVVYYPLLGKARGDWVCRQMTVAVRTGSPGMAPESLVPAIRRELGQLSPDLPVANVRTLEEVVHRARSRIEFSTLMVLLATLVALALGAVGLYGFVSYLVGQRAPEIGIRMALGATEGAIRWMVLREALTIAAAGLAVGLGGAMVLAGWTSTLLFEVSPRDPLAFSVAPLLLVAVTLLASYLPADRAARVEPRMALQRLE